MAGDVRASGRYAWLEAATILDLQAAMDAGELSSRELTMAYLLRIADFNQQGSVLNAVLEINPDAVQIAEGLDAERHKRGPRGPLHGIPVLLKDNVATADKMHTSAGSLALARAYAPEDAFIVRQLRKAGAVVLGKTNMTEWANFMAENMPNGYSSRGGQVLNPYGPGHFDVGGSSSGSGAAMAAAFAAAAVGTETSGSILSPASANSIVGIKPTVGLVSRSGIIPIAHSQDTAGPMARSVADAALLLGCLTGIDERDPATLTSLGRYLSDYTNYLEPGGLVGARIGIPRQPYWEGLSEEQAAIVERAIEALKSCGATVVDGVVVPSAEEQTDYDVLTYEFKPDLNAYLARLGPGVPRSLLEVIHFNEQHAELTLRHGQSVLLESERTSGTLTERRYLEARARDLRHARQEGIDAVLGEHDLDALLFPGAKGSGIAAKAGYPSVCVPAGYTAEGEPFGVTFTGSAFQESILIKLAHAFEQCTKFRVAPIL